MKLDRLLAIVMLLLNKERITAQELSERFEVSIRTIQRDIDAICMAGIPIVAQRGQQGGYGIIDTYKVDKSFFTYDEIQVLLASLKGVTKAYDDPNLKMIMEKIMTLQENEGNWHVEMDFSPWGISKEQKQRLEDIRNALSSKRVLRFEYINANGETSIRTVEPGSMLLKINTWYLYGFCKLRDDFRLFKISRIRHLEVQDEICDSDRVYKPYTFHYDSRPIVELKLRFEKSALNRLDDYFELDDMKIKDDLIDITVTYPLDEWIYSTLLSFGDQVEVLEPDHVRQEIQKRAKQILSKYD
ncbi:helix-turn-helix transcriptional regulator [Vallitalea okinawensis]|uniref:helix-turn-helix transcriptional regulator n=1 Tax=Vallitalea okinawensis TaxID=2078660 RepID=UPI000CFD1E48|nr:YafY family protein [Vallitalea okinawensis]